MPLAMYFPHIMSSGDPIEDALVELFNALTQIAIASIRGKSCYLMASDGLPAWCHAAFAHTSEERHRGVAGLAVKRVELACAAEGIERPPGLRIAPAAVGWCYSRALGNRRDAVRAAFLAAGCTGRDVEVVQALAAYCCQCPACGQEIAAEMFPDTNLRGNLAALVAEVTTGHACMSGQSVCRGGFSAGLTADQILVNAVYSRTAFKDWHLYVALTDQSAKVDTLFAIAYAFAASVEYCDDCGVRSSRSMVPFVCKSALKRQVIDWRPVAGILAKELRPRAMVLPPVIV